MAEAEQRSAQTMGVLVRVGVPLLFAAIVLPLIGRVYLALYEPAAGEASLGWTNAAVFVVQALPALVLSWAMFGVSSILSEYSAGRFLSLKASRSMKRVGQAAVFALLFNAFAVPAIVAWLHGTPMIASLNADVFDLCVLMFASGMLTVGAVLEGAARGLQDENDQIL